MIVEYIRDRAAQPLARGTEQTCRRGLAAVRPSRGA
jgi:hypothetical protein